MREMRDADRARISRIASVDEVDDNRHSQEIKICPWEKAANCKRYEAEC